jgi:hypothetical protein
MNIWIQLEIPGVLFPAEQSGRYQSPQGGQFEIVVYLKQAADDLFVFLRFESTRAVYQHSPGPYDSCCCCQELELQLGQAVNVAFCSVPACIGAPDEDTKI